MNNQPLTAHRLKDAMVDRKMSIRTLATKLGLSLGTTREYINGKKTPTPAAASKLAAVLGHTPAYWMGEAEAPAPVVPATGKRYATGMIHPLTGQLI